MELLTLNKINKSIKSKNILKDVSFTLNSSDIIGLVGGNGAGKTTLMKVILGLSSHQSGTLESHTSNKINDIGALIENPGLYPFLTGFENMKLINEDKDTSNIQQIVDKLEMNDFIHSKVKTYSLGMKQKLGVALALLNHPKLVILDEPMNGLDPKAVKNVRETIIDFKNQGVTFLISSHILSELVKVTDSILIIDKGKIIKETTMEELNQSNESDLENILLDIIDQKGGTVVMGTLINQELYKILKKKSSIIIPIIIFILMIAMAILSNNHEDILKPESQFKQGYTGFSWIFFLMIIQAATIITMEFHYGTIKNLLYRNYSRMSIILSKFIALFIYSLALFIVTTLISLVLKLILFSDMGILKQSGDNLSLLQEHLLTALATYIGMWLILSLTLLISCLLKSPGVSIAVGIVFYFASSVISGILFAAINQWEWLKWNPINMLNLSSQILDNEAFKKMTKLELHEIYIGNIVYIIIFLALVIFAFKKKNV